MFLSKNRVHFIHAFRGFVAKFWLSLFVLSLALPSQAKEVDLTNWQSMDAETYSSLLRGIMPGDVIRYHINGKWVELHVVRRINEARLVGTDGTSTQLFELEDGWGVRLPSETIYAGMQEASYNSRKFFVDTGFKHAFEVDEANSHLPNFFKVKIVRFKFGIKEIVPLMEHNDASWIMAKLMRKITPTERERIKEAGYEFFRDLARYTGGADDFGMQQIVYDLDAHKVVILDFLTPPKIYDPHSLAEQPPPIEFWVDHEEAAQYGNDYQPPYKVSANTHRFLSEIIDKERSQMKTMVECDQEMNNSIPKLNLSSQPLANPNH